MIRGIVYIQLELFLQSLFGKVHLALYEIDGNGVQNEHCSCPSFYIDRVIPTHEVEGTSPILRNSHPKACVGTVFLGDETPANARLFVIFIPDQKNQRGDVPEGGGDTKLKVYCEITEAGDEKFLEPEQKTD